MKTAALIGLGMVAQTHLDAIRDSAMVDLVGVMGRYPAKAARFADHAAAVLEHPVKTYWNAADVAADPSVDFVILATPPDARRDLVAALAGAGKPLLLEKPLERSKAAAEELVRLCAASNTPLAVLFQHRAREASQALKRCVSNRDLGEVTSVEIRVPWWRDQSYYDVAGRGTYARDGGGVLITQAIHTLDLALWVLGPITRVQALLRRTRTHRLEAENWAGALFETEAGCVGTLMATTAAFPGEAESIALHGTKASAHLHSGVLYLHHHDGRRQSFGETAGTGGGADPMAFTHAWHQSIIEIFARAPYMDDPLLCSGREALGTLTLIDAMTQSSETGRWTEVTTT